MITFNTTACICVHDMYGITYNICKIVHTLNKDDSFCYTFIPNYHILSLIENRNDIIFNGIPGIDLSLKKKQYLRKNITPVFISQRIPSKFDKSLNSFLNEANLRYLEPIQYLYNTNISYFGDNLFVLPYIKKDVISIRSITSKDNINIMVLKCLKSLALGHDIKIDNTIINIEQNKEIFLLLFEMYKKNKKINENKINDGIKKVKLKGRPKAKLDIIKVMEVLDKINNNQISIQDACKLLNITKDKFYRLKKEYLDDIEKA